MMRRRVTTAYTALTCNASHSRNRMLTNLNVQLCATDFTNMQFISTVLLASYNPLSYNAVRIRTCYSKHKRLTKYLGLQICTCRQSSTILRSPIMQQFNKLSSAFISSLPGSLLKPKQRHSKSYSFLSTTEQITAK